LKLRIALLALVLCAVTFAFGLGEGAAQSRPGVQIAQYGVVKQIIIEGSERVEPGTVKSYLLIREGDAYDAQRVDRSLKSLFKTGLFADVSIHRDGENLVVKVVENPVINRIAFEGNRSRESDVLEAEVTLRPRVIYTRAKVQADVRRILTLYRRSGRFAATVEPKIIQLAQNRVDLVFEISEGDQTSIRSIRFVGNNKFSDGQLREIVQTRESAWFRFFTIDDVYDPDRMTLDRELLRHLYLSEGFADFRVLSATAELTPDFKGFFITFTVDEGKRYKFGDIKIAAQLRNLNADDLHDVIKIKSGDWYDIDNIGKTIDAMTHKVGELGFAFVDIRPRIKRDPGTRKLNITFEVKEGPRVFVERIEISGNVRTLDKVIRREFQLVEGDAFNSAKLRRSRKRIQNLNFFEAVKVEQVPGSVNDKAVIKVHVDEKSTGSISVAAGFSTGAGILGEVSLNESNFLGRGQRVSVKTTLAASRSQIDFSFTEPFFLDRHLKAGIDIYHVKQDLQDMSSSDTERSGFSLRTGFPITDKLGQTVRYTIKRSKITSVSDSASTLIKDQVGTEFLSSISTELVYDATDNRLNPREGYFTSGGFELAGLGGTLNHLRTTGSTTYFYPVADEWVLTVKGNVGYIVGLGKDVHFLERFFVGGSDLRGFATSGIGPRDKLTNDALGAEWKYTGTLQLGLPLGLPDDFGVLGRIFTDFGSAGKLEPSNSNVNDTGGIRASSGVGFTWKSPFGPIGLDLALPLIKEDFDEEEIVRVNFGTRF